MWNRVLNQSAPSSLGNSVERSLKQAVGRTSSANITFFYNDAMTLLNTDINMLYVFCLNNALWVNFLIVFLIFTLYLELSVLFFIAFFFILVYPSVFCVSLFMVP